MSDRTPRAVLPTRAFVLALADVIKTNDYFYMSEAVFISAVMKAARGQTDPNLVREAYHELMREAGLPPIA